MRRRVVIVSVGVVSPAGCNWEEFGERIFLEKDWFTPLDPRCGYPCGGAVPRCVIEDFFRKRRGRFKYRRYYNRAVELAVAASLECLEKCPEGSIPLRELSIFWGTGPNLDMARYPAHLHGSRPAVEGDGYLVEGDGNLDAEPPGSGRAAAWMLHYLPNLSASAISCAVEARGEALTYVTACAASSHAVGEAFLKIRNGDLDFALCGGSDSRLHPGGISAYAMLGALARGEAPGEAPKVLPFCEGRSGFVPGEGAAAFLLMDHRLAVSKGLPVLAELIGYGASSDGYRLTDPDPEGRGMERAMVRALKSADIPPEAVDLVNAHGTGTLKNDEAEAAAIQRLFPHFPAVTSNKAQVGHLSGACGAVELAACVRMLETRRATPTANTAGRPIEYAIDLVTTSRFMPIETILCNSFGFGGQNGALIVRRANP